MGRSFCPDCFREFKQTSHTCPDCGVAVVPMAHRELAGTTLDNRYEILSEIGSGGFGTVYRARHKLLRRDVAIKVLDPRLILDLDKIAVRRFMDEARLISQLENRHIVRLHDCAFTRQGVMYFAMELLQGQTLRQLLKEDDRFDLARISRIVLQVCSGLEHAHQRSIIHRDLKPENIFIVTTNEGEEVAKILDFGISKFLETDTSPGSPQTTGRSRTTLHFCTPTYASPEQLSGIRTNPRSDIYSLGLVVVEMLRGRPVFEGTVEQAMRKRLKASVPFEESAEELGVPRSIVELLMRCLSLSPDDRPSSAAEFGRVFEASLAHFMAKAGRTAEPGIEKRGPDSFKSVSAEPDSVEPRESEQDRENQEVDDSRPDSDLQPVSLGPDANATVLLRKPMSKPGQDAEAPGASRPALRWKRILWLAGLSGLGIASLVVVILSTDPWPGNGGPEARREPVKLRKTGTVGIREERSDPASETPSSRRTAELRGSAPATPRLSMQGRVPRGRAVEKASGTTVASHEEKPVPDPDAATPEGTDGAASVRVPASASGSATKGNPVPPDAEGGRVIPRVASVQARTFDSKQQPTTTKIKELTTLIRNRLAGSHCLSGNRVLSQKHAISMFARLRLNREGKVQSVDVTDRSVDSHESQATLERCVEREIHQEWVFEPDQGLSELYFHFRL